MRAFTNRLFLLCGFFIFAACSTWNPLDEGGLYESSLTIEIPQQLEAARKQFAKGQYEKAAFSIDRLLLQNQQTYWYGKALLIKAESLEMQGLRAEAIDLYKEIISHSAGYDSGLMYTALYRLSFIYQKQKDFQVLLPVVRDLEQIAKTKKDTAYQHAKARRGQALAALGRWNKAVEVQQQVNQRMRFYKKKKMTIPLYIIAANSWIDIDVTGKEGNINDRIEATQEGLMKLVEVGTYEWSKKAKHRLVDLYTALSVSQRQATKQKTAVVQDRKNRQQIEELVRLNDLMDRLVSQRRVRSNVINESLTKELIGSLESIKEKNRQAVYQLQIGLTESEKLPVAKEKEAVPVKRKELKIPKRVEKKFLEPR